MPSTDQQALSLQWAYGLTKSKGGVINLSDGGPMRVFYTAAHTAIIYDAQLRKQTVLQGHTNRITCSAASADRKLVVTGDVGEDSLVVLWNTAQAQPALTIPNPHPYGVCALDIAPDASFLVTLSAVDPATKQQEIALWNLQQSESRGTPTCRAVVPAGDPQEWVRFHPESTAEIVTNGAQRVYFWAPRLPPPEAFPDPGTFKYYSPPISSADFKQSIGNFTCSVFVPGTAQALTATDDGDVVVWDEQGISATVGTHASDRKASKLMRIHSDAVTFMATEGDHIVTGGADGFVRFFDPTLRLLAWFEDLAAGEVTSISFSLVPPVIPDMENDDLDIFLAPDFMVGTKDGIIKAVASACFDDYGADRSGTTVIRGALTDITAIATDPLQPQFAVVGPSGELQVWDASTHTMLHSSSLGSSPGTALTYSRDGSVIVVGSANGAVSVLESAGLAEVASFTHSRGPIKRVAISSSGGHIAAADGGSYVLLAALLPYKHKHRWEYLGRYMSHHGPINSLVFGEAPSGQTRLFTVGGDGRLAEYDLTTSSTSEGVSLVSLQRLAPQSAPPTALAFTPPVAYYAKRFTETELLVAFADHKCRLFNPDGRRFSSCYLGPTYGGPVASMTMFQSIVSEGAFLAYHTEERIAGLVAWPIDGDPSRTMGVIAHPGSIVGMAVQYDGRKLLTAGDDGVVHQWEISTPALEATMQPAGCDGPKWEGLLDSPEQLEEIKDYFYYAQISAQGEDATAPRRITGRIPTDMVPDLMCALGYYPTQGEITNMMADLRFQYSMRDKPMPPDIDFHTFLALYINYRPATPIHKEDIHEALVALGGREADGALPREALIEALRRLGEKMKEEELAEAVQLLTGADDIEGAIPDTVTTNALAVDVLGFDDGAQTD